MRWLILDLGGVMVRIRHRWDEIGATMGIELPESPLATCEVLRRFQGAETGEETYLRELAAHYGIPSDRATEFHQRILIGEYPGIAEFIQRVRKSGFGVGCFSNTNAPHWRQMSDPALYPTVANLDIRVASHEIGANKPEPAAYESVERATKASGKQIVFVDDSLPNVEAARERGWQAYHIRPQQAVSDLNSVWDWVTR
ncbi:MAG: HAD-IA family hydrolase [Fimbriimonadaceae bacterium]|nr:HAD-IA family hydrolase [Fimbriimonadaceae bacterium]